MLLAEKITELRKKQGWSQEELAQKLDISRQSVSKWESGGAMPDLDKIIKLSSLFGVSTDYLLKDDEETFHDTDNNIYEDTECETDNVKHISRSEAERYMNTVLGVSKKMAVAISIMILSPICLIQLSGYAEYYNKITEEMAGAVGVAVLLAIIAAGVAMCIINVSRLSEFEYIGKEEIKLDNGVADMVKCKSDDNAHSFTVRFATGVVLCILGVIPLILASAFESGDTEYEYIYVTCVNVLLAFVSIAVYFFVSAGMVKESYDKLLQTGDYTKEKKETAKKISFFPGAYWCLVTAIYLGISFYSDRWDRTWIIWPVAGVLFAAVYSIVGAAAKSKPE